MNIAEIALLAVALIAIIRASLNYIKIDDLSGIKLEGFTSKSRKSGVKTRGKNKMEDITVLESEKSKEYFDTDKLEDDNKNPFISTISTQPLETVSETNKINKDAVNQVNSILGISKFGDIPTTTKSSSAKSSSAKSSSTSSSNGIESTFSPQIQIGKGAKDTLNNNMLNLFNMGGVNALGTIGNKDIASEAAGWGTAFSNDGMSFKKTMKPSGDLWSSDLDYMDNNSNWTQNLNDFNNGKWNPKLYKNPSDYTDYYTPSAYGMSTPSSTNSKNTANSVATTTTTANRSSSSFKDIPEATTLDSNGQPKKLCGAYDDLSMEQSGNLVIKNYSQAKKWVPGYTYVPPVYWDVPHRHTSVCQGPNPNARKLTGLVDRGLPLNVLELNPDGKIADTEDSVSLTNVGSIMPKFTYQETPYSSPYI